MHSALLPSPIGPLYVEADEHGLTKLFTDGHRAHAAKYPRGEDVGDAGPFEALARQLDEYFNQERTTFDVPLSIHGTDFEKRVWNGLLQIPYGETLSYGELAREVGGSPRAVGRANGRNQISIIIPCHRVIGADGSLTGYGGGLDAKRSLLELEQGVGSMSYGVSNPR